MGWTWQVRSSSLHRKLMLCGYQAGLAVRTKETVLWTGRQPSVWCPWQVFFSCNTASQFFLLFLSGCFVLFIRCFNFTKHARDLGFGIFISFYWFCANDWLTARESINKQINIGREEYGLATFTSTSLERLPWCYLTHKYVITFVLFWSICLANWMWWLTFMCFLPESTMACLDTWSQLHSRLQFISVSHHRANHF